MIAVQTEIPKTDWKRAPFSLEPNRKNRGSRGEEPVDRLEAATSVYV
jgi:hypothetical protein